MPFVVTIEEVDAPQFRRALQTKQPIEDILVEVIRPAGPGKIEHYKTIRLTNATVSNVRMQKRGALGGKPNGNEHVLVDFTYQKIEITNVNSRKADVDDWMN